MYLDSVHPKILYCSGTTTDNEAKLFILNAIDLVSLQSPLDY